MANSSGSQVNKTHKTRFASKSSRNVHKLSSEEKHRNAKSNRGTVAKGAKDARRQRSKMMMEQKRAAVLKEKRESSGPTSPPRVIMLFGLSSSVNLNSLEEEILSLLTAGRNGVIYPAVASPEYGMRSTVLKAPYGDLLTCMERAKVADLIAFVASTNSLCEENDTNHFIDSFGSQCLSAFRIIGFPSTTVLIRDLPDDLKKKHELKKLCMSALSPVFPEDCKFYAADNKDELHKFMWLFKEQKISSPHWRHERSYVMSQKVEVIDDDSSLGKRTLVVTGYVRARGLSVNQLVHVSGAGDFQMSKIEHLKDPCVLNVKKRGNFMDAEEVEIAEVLRCLTPDPLKQEPLVVENVPDLLAGEQTWPTEAEMAEADTNREKKMKKKRVPMGTSEYQAAWIVDNSDIDYPKYDEGDNGMVMDDGETGIADNKFDEDGSSLKMRDSDDESCSIMTEGENLTKEQIEQIRKIKEAHAEDKEFPDEVDVPVDIAARKRFAKYRGVKSLKTSSWDPKESLPPEYGKIFAFDNFSETKKHVLSKSLKMEQDLEVTLPVGSYARIYIKEVPEIVATKLCTSKTLPLIVSGLLQHESKVSVLHCSIKKHYSYTAPIKAKEELIFQVGFRQFVARPTYYSDSTEACLRKMERYLHAGQDSAASVYAPLSLTSVSVPLIALKILDEDASPVIAGVGSLKSVDPDRIILKRIILTGYPQRVSKSKATVRYMFHNPEDVKWFKPVEVVTKCGNYGHIKEPVGTHGAMKCIMHKGVEQNDTVCMKLYKRTYPKWPQQWFPLQGAS